MTRWILFILLLALAPLPARAQDTDAAERIEAARRRAEAAGIPVSLLDGKVAEGRAKGVPMERIALAVEQRLVFLSRARDAMDGVGASVADLAVGADALAAGVTPQALEGVAKSATGSQRSVAIAVLQQLVQQGEGSERALERVRVALERNPQELRNLPAMKKGLGGPPEHVGRPRVIPDPGRNSETVGGDRAKGKNPRGKPPRGKPPLS